METFLRSFHSTTLHTSTNRLVVYTIFFAWLLLQNMCVGLSLDTTMNTQHSIRHPNNKPSALRQQRAAALGQSRHDDLTLRGTADRQLATAPLDTGVYLISSECNSKSYMTIHQSRVRTRPIASYSESVDRLVSIPTTAQIELVKKEGSGGEYYIRRYQSHKYICFNRRGAIRIKGRVSREDQCSYRVIEDTPPPPPQPPPPDTNPLLISNSDTALANSTEPNVNSSQALASPHALANSPVNDDEVTNPAPFSAVPPFPSDNQSQSRKSTRQSNHQSNRHYRIQSVARPTWHLGFKKNGDVMKGWHYGIKRDRCFELTLTLLAQESIGDSGPEGDSTVDEQLVETKRLYISEVLNTHQRGIAIPVSSSGT